MKRLLSYVLIAVLSATVSIATTFYLQKTGPKQEFMPYTEESMLIHTAVEGAEDTCNLLYPERKECIDSVLSTATPGCVRIFNPDGTVEFSFESRDEMLLSAFVTAVETKDRLWQFRGGFDAAFTRNPPYWTAIHEVVDMKDLDGDGYWSHVNGRIERDPKPSCEE